jgi:ribose 5-phosphate isomerase A
VGGIDTAKLKKQAAHRAVEFVQSGMIVGLGHGSTALYAARRIAELIHSESCRTYVACPVPGRYSKMHGDWEFRSLP